MVDKQRDESELANYEADIRISMEGTRNEIQLLEKVISHFQSRNEGGKIELTREQVQKFVVPLLIKLVRQATTTEVENEARYIKQIKNIT